MKKIVLTILALIVAGVVALAVVIALQPATFRVERSATIAAPAAAVFTQVNDFHNWDAWSPWAKRDPNMEQAFTGEPAGKGAVYTWKGNSEVGEGRMEIIDSVPNELVRIKLDFIEPFTSTCTTDFAFKSEGDGTHVTWSMYGNNNFFAKAIHLVFNLDKTVGGDFEKGLAQLKAVAEKSAQ